MAEMVKKWLFVVLAMTCASVVLPVPGGPHKMMEEKKFVGFDGAAQEFTFTDDVFLTDKFLQRALPHAGGKRSFGFHAFLHDVVKEIGHEMILPLPSVKTPLSRDS